MSLRPLTIESAATETPALNPRGSTPRGRLPIPPARRQFQQTVSVAFAMIAWQLAQGILLARLLGPVGLGEYATAIFYTQLLLYLGLCGGVEVVGRHATDATTPSRPLRRAALWLGLTTGLASTLLCIGLCTLAIPTDKRYLIPLGIVCSLSLVGQHVMLVITAVDRGCGDFRTYHFRRIIAAASFPALLLIATCVLKVDLVLTCWLQVAASLISMSVCLVGIHAPFRSPPQPPVMALLKESRPDGVSMLATEVFERLDLLLVLWLVPLLQQGFYIAMVPVVLPLTVIPNTLGIFWFNLGANRYQHFSRQALWQIIGLSLVVQTACTVAFLLVAGPIVPLLYGSEFAPAVAFALWLAPASAIRGVWQGLDSYLKGLGRPLASIRCRIAGGLVMVATTFGFLEAHGAIAIAIAAVLGQAVCLIWMVGILPADADQESF